MPSSNEYMRRYMIVRYRHKMSKWINHFGGKCVLCGSTTRLQFDHIDKTTKSFTIGESWSRSDTDVENELKKCQLLCFECHNTKTCEELGRVAAKRSHGTLSSYRYCKCELCRLAKKKDNAMRAADRNASRRRKKTRS